MLTVIVRYYIACSDVTTVTCNFMILCDVIASLLAKVIDKTLSSSCCRIMQSIRVKVYSLRSLSEGAIKLSDPENMRVVSKLYFVTQQMVNCACLT
jgi:hypothetical protein